METIVTVVHVILAIALVGFVLLQQGKGADAGAAFGGGASSTVFGASGTGNFLTRTTAFLALAFLVTSLTLASIYGHREVPKSIVEKANALGVPQVDADVPAGSNGGSGVPAIPETKSETAVGSLTDDKPMFNVEQKTPAVKETAPAASQAVPSAAAPIAEKGAAVPAQKEGTSK